MPRRPDLPDIDDPTRTKRLQRSYAKEIKGLYKNLAELLMKRIQPTISRYTVMGLLDDLEKDIDIELKIQIKMPSENMVRKNITLVYRGAKRDASNNPRIKRGHVLIPVEMNPLDQHALADLYSRNLNQIDNINQNVKSQLLITIEAGIRQHEGIYKIARDIKNKIPEITAPRAKVIARTELAHAYNVAISNSYQSAGIKQWQWLSALAETTCQDCQNLHGQVFDFGDPEPPLHPNCWLHHSTQILTDSGEKNICDIKIGDNVLTHEGHFKKVIRMLNKTHRYNGDAIRIMFKGKTLDHRNSVTVTPTHPFLTKRGWIEAKSINQSDELFVIANHCRYCGEKIPYWKEFCDQNHKFKFMPEVCEKISESKKGEKNAMYGKCGELHHLWKGGKIQYRGGDWDAVRIDALKRDNYICQRCGIDNNKCNELYGQNLQVHHITPYRDCRCNELDNLMTVCHSCHKLIEGTDNEKILGMGGFEFISVPVLQTKILHNFNGEKLYNFAVEDDESYIAKGIISHNCLCTQYPIVLEPFER